MSSQLGFIEPQLLTSVDQPPQGDEWLHEIKHDGYRTLLVVEGKQARAYTRTGVDWTNRYPGIVTAAAKLNCRSAILDGEVIVQDERGASDFDALMSAIRWNPHKLILYAFDLLHLDGMDLRERPLVERRAKLKELLGLDDTSPLQLSEEFIGDPVAFFRGCAEYGLEEHRVKASVLTLPKRTKQDMAQVQMLHRKLLRDHRHGSRPQDRRNVGVARKR